MLRAISKKMSSPSTSSLPMNQIEQLSEMKISRLDREYQACIAATRQPEAPLLEIDSKSTKDNIAEDEETMGYSRVPSSSLDVNNDDDDDNGGGYELFGGVASDEVDDAPVSSSEAAAGSEDSSSDNLDPSIPPLTEDTASTIKSLVSSMSIAPPPWAPKMDDGTLDHEFDEFVVERIQNWGKEDFSSFIEERNGDGDLDRDEATASRDMEEWVATFSDVSIPVVAAAAKSTKKRKKKKAKKKRRD